MVLLSCSGTGDGIYAQTSKRSGSTQLRSGFSEERDHIQERRLAASVRADERSEGTHILLDCFQAAESTCFNTGDLSVQIKLVAGASGDLLLSLAALSIPARSPFSVIFKHSQSGSSRIASISARMASLAP